MALGVTEGRCASLGFPALSTSILKSRLSGIIISITQDDLSLLEKNQTNKISKLLNIQWLRSSKTRLLAVNESPTLLLAFLVWAALHFDQLAFTTGYVVFSHPNTSLRPGFLYFYFFYFFCTILYFDCHMGYVELLEGTALFTLQTSLNYCREKTPSYPIKWICWYSIHIACESLIVQWYTPLTCVWAAWDRFPLGGGVNSYSSLVSWDRLPRPCSG